MADRLHSHGGGDTNALSDVDPFLAARRLRTPTWIYDIDACRILHANASACSLWHAQSEAELQARDLSKDMSATVRKRLKQYQTDFLAGDASFHEMWTLFPNGTPTSVMVTYTGFRLSDGRMAMQCEVIGEREDEPDNLRSAEALLHTDVMIGLFSYRGPPIYLNPAARNIVTKADTPLADLFRTRADFDVLMFGLDGGGEHRQIAHVSTRQGPRWFDISAKQCSDAVTGDPAILITAIDVSELKMARDQARFLASRDQLTGCYNRNHLQAHMMHLARSGALQSALIYFDVDRFKQTNDTFGHEVGDGVLTALAERANQHVSTDDAVVRLGGDEFVVVFANARDDEIEVLVDRLFDALNAAMPCGGVSVPTRVSMGISLFDPRNADLETELRRADIALYAAKKQGRHRYILYSDDMGLEAAKRQRTETQIEAALLCHEFELHYQPRVDLRSGRIVCVEGLARWRHPERGLVAPDEFIPICEETGMIHALGQQVIEMGFNQAKAWHDAGFSTGVSLNISPRQFSDNQLFETLSHYAAQPGFPTQKIELEITEGVLIGDQEGIAAKLQAITELGYRIAVGDFGTGYSNLSYISRFPLHCLKIDRSFVEQLPASGPVVRLIIGLAQQIGTTVVAEGVETKAQYDWLVERGCEQAQGYYLAHPVPAADTEALLQFH